MGAPPVQLAGIYGLPTLFTDGNKVDKRGYYTVPEHVAGQSKDGYLPVKDLYQHLLKNRNSTKKAPSLKEFVDVTLTESLQKNRFDFYSAMDNDPSRKSDYPEDAKESTVYSGMTIRNDGSVAVHRWDGKPDENASLYVHPKTSRIFLPESLR
jgi:hypothetical protein